MSSDLHMHVASLQVQDRMRAASTARLTKQASPATATPTVSLVVLRRLFHPTVRRVW